MAEPEGLFNSLPGTALHRILETFAEQGDGRALGSAACVCSTWKRAARDDLWKTACNQAESERTRQLFVADSLFRPDRLARRIDAVQFDRVHRPTGRKRPFREAYFSVDGSAHSGSDQGLTILRFAAAIASGEVDQVVLTPEAYFADVCASSRASAAAEKKAAVAKVMDWALQIGWNHDRLPHVTDQPTWAGSGFRGAGWMAFYRAIRSVTPLVVDALMARDHSFSQLVALDLLNALGCVSPHCGGDLIADFLVSDSEVLPGLCTYFSNAIGTPISAKVLSTIICLCCGNENRFLWVRGEKNITLSGLQTVASCGLQGMVQRALEEGDAVAQEGTKFISWIRASLPHAVHELSEYPLHCLRLLAAASAAEPAASLSPPAVSDPDAIEHARNRFGALVDSFVESLAALESEASRGTVALELAVASLPVLAKLEPSLGPGIAKAVSTLTLLAGFSGLRALLESFSTSLLMAVVEEMGREVYLLVNTAEDWTEQEAILTELCGWLEGRMTPGMQVKLQLSLRDSQDTYQLRRRRARAVPDKPVDQALLDFLLPGNEYDWGLDAVDISRDMATAMASKVMDMYQGSLFPGTMGMFEYHLCRTSYKILAKSTAARTAMLELGALSVMLRLSVESKGRGVYEEFGQVIWLLSKHAVATQQTLAENGTGFQIPHENNPGAPPPPESNRGFEGPSEIGSGFENPAGASAGFEIPPENLLLDAFTRNISKLDAQINYRGAVDHDILRVRILESVADLYVLRGSLPSLDTAPHVRALNATLPQMDVALRLNRGFIVQGGDDYLYKWHVLADHALPALVAAVLPIALGSVPYGQLEELWLSELWQRSLRPVVLVRGMRVYATVVRVQRCGAKLVRLLLDPSSSLDQDFDLEATGLALLEAGVIPALVMALQRHSISGDLVIGACKALLALLELDTVLPDHDHVKKMLADSGVVPVLWQCWRALRARADVVQNILQVLGQIGSSHRTVQAVVKDGGVHEMLLGMRVHARDELVQQWGFRALFHVALMHSTAFIVHLRQTGELLPGDLDEASRTIKRAGGIEMGVAAMQTWVDNPEVQHQACGMLRVCRYEAIAEVADAGAQTLWELNGGPAVLEAMRRAREHEEVQMQALLFLSSHSYNDVQASGSLITKGVMGEALEVVRRHRENHHMNVVAFGLLRDVLVCGSEEEQQAKHRSFVEQGGVEEAVESMRFWQTENPRLRAEVHRAVLQLLLPMVQSRGEVRDRMGAKGGLEVVRETLAVHAGSEHHTLYAGLGELADLLIE